MQRVDRNNICFMLDTNIHFKITKLMRAFQQSYSSAVMLRVICSSTFAFRPFPSFLQTLKRLEAH